MWVGSKQLAKNADLSLPTISSGADFSRLHLQTAGQIFAQFFRDCDVTAGAQASPRFVFVINSRGFLAVRKHFISLFLESVPSLPFPHKGIASKATHNVILLSSPTLGNSSALYLMQLG